MNSTALSFAGKKVLDIGCGMGISTIAFAEMGADLTFVDIIEDNVRLVQRLCALKGINAKFLYMENIESLAALDHNYDVVTAIGSLINAPLAVTKVEVDAIKMHLKPGGRWLQPLSEPRWLFWSGMANEEQCGWSEIAAPSGRSRRADRPRVVQGRGFKTLLIGIRLFGSVSG
jgi:SAM-dependent methyltransferase